MTSTPTIRPAPPAVNDEEPSAEAMDRLWAALDATLDPADSNTLPPVAPAASEWCRRCGYGRLFGTWRPRSARPHGCPFCHSSYWDKPAMTTRGRKPPRTSPEVLERRIAAEKAGRAAQRRRYRHLAKVKKLALELGFDLTDPRNGKVLASANSAKAASIKPAPPTPTPTLTATPIPPSVAEFRRTVPPPPGLDDLDGGSTR